MWWSAFLRLIVAIMLVLALPTSSERATVDADGSLTMNSYEDELRVLKREMVMLKKEVDALKNTVYGGNAPLGVNAHEDRPLGDWLLPMTTIEYVEGIDFLGMASFRGKFSSRSSRRHPSAPVIPTGLRVVVGMSADGRGVVWDALDGREVGGKDVEEGGDGCFLGEKGQKVVGMSVGGTGTPLVAGVYDGGGLRVWELLAWEDGRVLSGREEWNGTEVEGLVVRWRLRLELCLGAHVHGWLGLNASQTVHVRPTAVDLAASRGVGTVAVGDDGGRMFLLSTNDGGLKSVVRGVFSEGLAANNTRRQRNVVTDVSLEKVPDDQKEEVLETGASKVTAITRLGGSVVFARGTEIASVLAHTGVPQGRPCSLPPSVGSVSSLAADALAAGVLWVGSTEGSAVAIQTRTTRTPTAKPVTSQCPIVASVTVGNGSSPVLLATMRGYTVLGDAHHLTAVNVTSLSSLGPQPIASSTAISTSLLSSFPTGRLAEIDVAVVVGNRTHLHILRSLLPYSRPAPFDISVYRIPLIALAVGGVLFWQIMNRKKGANLSNPIEALFASFPSTNNTQKSSPQVTPAERLKIERLMARLQHSQSAGNPQSIPPQQHHQTQMPDIPLWADARGGLPAFDEEDEDQIPLD